MDQRKNCLNIIRLFAALNVFLGHASIHLKIPIAKSLFIIIDYFRGVPIFFILSGFLIWLSLERTLSFESYFKKRILRLYPELLGGVLFSVIIVILFKKNIPWVSFFIWIITQSTVLQFWTPTFLREFGCGVPNGALWTIGVMVQTYLVLYIVYHFLHNKQLYKWGVLFGIGIIFNIITPMASNLVSPIIYKLFGQTFIPYLWLFILGAFLSENYDNLLEVLKGYWLLFFGLSFFFSVTGFDIGIYGTLKSLFTAPAIIGFAYKFPQLDLKYDFSYGFYIYHMPVINILIEMGMVEKVWYMFFAFIMAFMLAILSYMSFGSVGKNIKKNISVI